MNHSKLIQRLRESIGGDRISTSEEDLLNHSVDHFYEYLNPKKNVKPLLVVRPKNSRQVAEVLRIANELKIPIIPRGAGTGYTGGAATPKSGLVLDMTEMNQIIQINEIDLTVTVEPGVRVKKLQGELETRGLTLGHYPGSYADLTIGGAIATDGTGLLIAKYGAIGNAVIDLEVVVPTGEIVKTSSVPLYKSGLGFNLQKIFVGSEGTLGIITQATIRVCTKPEARIVHPFEFSTFDSAFNAATGLVKKGLRPGMYLVEGRRVSYTLLGLDYQGILLFVIFEGFKEEVETQSKAAIKICEELGGKNAGDDLGEAFFGFYTGGMFCYLYEKSYADRLKSHDTTKFYDFIEATVQVSQVPELCQFIRETNVKLGFQPSLGVLYFYPEILVVTDANFAFDFTDEEQVKKFRTLEEAIAKRTLLMGGSVTVAHGTGSRHVSSLPRAFRKDTIETMNKIKTALDPNGIMNPSKKFFKVN